MQGIRVSHSSSSMSMFTTASTMTPQLGSGAWNFGLGSPEITPSRKTQSAIASAVSGAEMQGRVSEKVSTPDQQEYRGSAAKCAAVAAEVELVQGFGDQLAVSFAPADLMTANTSPLSPILMPSTIAAELEAAAGIMTSAEVGPSRKTSLMPQEHSD